MATTDVNGRLHGGAGESNPGRFSPMNRPDGDVSLAPEWGDARVKVGTRSPWGVVTDVIELAPGIVHFDTDAHGGLKVSRQRNAAIHEALRRPGGWYGSHTEAAIVGWHFPADTRSRVELGYPFDVTEEQEHAICETTVREHFPDGYAALIGR